jgi:hypothetical protein
MPSQDGIDGRPSRAVDGMAITSEIVVAATGYTSQPSNLWVDDRIEPDLKTMTTGTSRIWFIGMEPSLVSYFRNALKEAVRISRQLRL